MANYNHSAVIGRFMSVRPVEKTAFINVTGSENDRDFIIYPYPESPSTFFAALVEDRNADNARENLLGDADTFYSNASSGFTSANIISVRQLYTGDSILGAFFQRFDRLEEWINKIPDDLKVEDAKPQIAVALGVDGWSNVQDIIIRFYDTDNYCVYLWDNLFAQYIKPTNLRLSICKEINRTFAFKKANEET